MVDIDDIASEIALGDFPPGFVLKIAAALNELAGWRAVAQKRKAETRIRVAAHRARSIDVTVTGDNVTIERPDVTVTDPDVTVTVTVTEPPSPPSSPSPKERSPTPSKERTSSLSSPSDPLNPPLEGIPQGLEMAAAETIEQPVPKAAKSVGTRLPTDWQPSDDDWRYALDTGLSEEACDIELASFTSFWLSKPGAAAKKVSWSLTWKGWIIREVKKKIEQAERDARFKRDREQPKRRMAI